ncbi:hypothetical protein HRR85_009613 [Exophiala dermatitidis]|nr:hypothetical protein HRR85_009613 [Exophiala dermatitidis]
MELVGGYLGQIERLVAGLADIPTLGQLRTRLDSYAYNVVGASLAAVAIGEEDNDGCITITNTCEDWRTQSVDTLACLRTWIAEDMDCNEEIVPRQQSLPLYE